MISAVSLPQAFGLALGFGFFVWEIVSNFREGRKEAESDARSVVTKRYRSSVTSSNQGHVE